MTRHYVSALDSVVHPAADDTLLLRSTITMGANSTTEVKTAALSLIGQHLAPDQRCLLVVDRDDDATAGDMTFKTYILCKIDGTNSVDVLVDSQTVENVASSRGAETFILNEGLGSAEGTIKFGALFAGNGGLVVVNISLYSL